MKKRVFIIVGYVLLLCIAVGLCMYAIPYNTNINTSMQATKMDKDGKVLGTDEIVLQGSFKNYLFKEDKLELAIDSFGNLKSIKLANDNRGNTSIVPVAFDDYFHFTFMAWDTTNGKPIFGSITTSQNFDYWVFRVSDNDNPIYYVASANEHTLEEIVQYFQGLAPGYKAP